MFQNTFGFGRDSNKAAKELGDFGDTLFNVSAGEAAAPMEVCVECRVFVWGWWCVPLSECVRVKAVGCEVMG